MAWKTGIHCEAEDYSQPYIWHSEKINHTIQLQFQEINLKGKSVEKLHKSRTILPWLVPVCEMIARRDV